MSLLLSTLAISYLCTSFGFRLQTAWKMASHLPMARRSPTSKPLQGRGAPTLLPQPPSNSIANFVDNQSSDMSFIQCNILAMGEIDGQQYGVGFPIDMPVMLTYFDNNELKPVKPDYPDYDHLINHVSVQLDSDDFQLYKTPIVLTLQGEFEDAEFNAVNPFELKSEQDSEANMSNGFDDDYMMGEEDDDAKELTLEQLMKSVEQDLDADWNEEVDHTETSEEAENEHEDTATHDSDTDPVDSDSNSNMSSFWSSPIISAKGTSGQDNNKPDITLTRPEKFDPAGIPDEATVSAEDTRDLQRAHRKADRIMEYAQDIKLIGSFHYQKRNFHLVRLLEPIFVMGRRIPDIKGYFFSLLDEQETEQVRPVLEELLIAKARSPVATDTIDDFGVNAKNSGSARDREGGFISDSEAEHHEGSRRGAYGVSASIRSGGRDSRDSRDRGRGAGSPQRAHSDTPVTTTASSSTSSSSSSNGTGRASISRPAHSNNSNNSNNNMNSRATDTGQAELDSESRFQKARRKWKDLKNKERSA